VGNRCGRHNAWRALPRSPRTTLSSLKGDIVVLLYARRSDLSNASLHWLDGPRDSVFRDWRNWSSRAASSPCRCLRTRPALAQADGGDCRLKFVLGGVGGKKKKKRKPPKLADEAALRRRCLLRRHTPPPSVAASASTRWRRLYYFLRQGPTRCSNGVRGLVVSRL